MKLTRQHRRNARLLWQSVSVNGVPDANRIRETVRTIQQSHGRDAEAVLKCFAQRLDVYIRANRIAVVSADRLSAAQQEQLNGRFRETGAANLGVQFSVDPSVIGGLRVEQGYQVTDLTLARQLELLHDKLL
ncbi:MAG: F0F1 ATP synthase subunit delta [Pontiellaceae bacterium]|jgi:F0F1-type ATP synthase delta subunit|nr:F0F1 ATP synthase subunit delta [Pontiellaceae bacterium]